MTIKTRRLIMTGLAPPRPPCFSDRAQWIEYLSSAEHGAKGRDCGPTLGRKPEPPTFNYAFNFCRDCPKGHELEMVKQGRCNPGHLRDLEMYAPKVGTDD